MSKLLDYLTKVQKMELNLLYLEKLKNHLNQIIGIADAEISSLNKKKADVFKQSKDLDHQISNLKVQAAEEIPYKCPYSYPSFYLSAGKIILWGIVGFFAAAVLAVIVLTCLAPNGFEALLSGNPLENVDEATGLIGILGGGAIGFLISFIILIIMHISTKIAYKKISQMEAEYSLQEMPKLEALREEWIKKNTENLQSKKEPLRQRIMEIDNSIVRLKGKINQLMGFQNEIENQKAEISSTLQTAYETDIIYSKYRSLIPVTMFCEYLSSGRCSTLQGHEGAYNIYENEARMNVIITKLDAVIIGLNSIQATQHLLHTGISNIYSNIGALKSSADIQNAILSNSQKIMSEKTDMMLSLQNEHLEEIKKLSERN